MGGYEQIHTLRRRREISKDKIDILAIHCEFEIC